MEVVNEIVKGVVQVLMVPVKKQLDYVISHKKYLEDMHKKMKHLDAKKVGVESQKKQNRERRLEVPAQVSPWLEEVEQMNAKVADFPIEVPGCLDLKSRHKLGSKASKIIKEINSVLGRCPEIRGTELQIPLGRIDSTIVSTSTLSSDRSDFRSREHTFTKALEALGPNHSSHMVALWGMGGVGKTTMMKKLKEVVVEKKMFKHYVEAVIGEKTDPIAIQKAVAEYLGIDLTQTTKSARTNKLRTWFVNNSDGGKKKFLVILDDVWQPVDMEDIGLSRLPNQGIDFKVLMTSRNKYVCTEMGVKVDSILNVSCLIDSEAQSLFLQLWEPSDDVDADLYNIGEQIVRKCCGLPIAIKTMACTLRGKSKDAWKDALNRFQYPDNINTVAPTVFKTSYDNLQDEVIKETFLLCGLFPEDFNIPTEDLLRYGWGLKLFKGLGTIREARYRLNTCIERLMHTNLLIESNVLGCVKMHDLVRDFVLDMFSKEAHAAIVNHGSKPSWPENDMSASCKRISLTCVDMAEFPSDLKFPNLTLLKLMHGDESLRFPQGFYGKMEKLLVISYDRMKILPSLLVCCTNLRVLCLDKCSVRFDLSCIGNLSNLEVLNFANCGVKRLPSMIGNLKKLRVLDVSGCGGLRIDNDFFKKLVSLEELYACPFDIFHNAISFTGDNCNEVAERWRNISALEYEFFREKSQLMNLSYENLELFRISVECTLGDRNRFTESKHSFENTLNLVMKQGELVGSRINELFEKTIFLSLSVVDMNYLEDVAVKSLLRPQPSSFRNIRVLVVSECAELRYIFTHSVANAMSNLEDLQVYDCLVMKELIHIESGEEGRITFPNLKSVVLRRLPKLSGLCQNVNIIALPQLVKLQIEGLPNIKSIYSKNKLAVDCFLREEVLVPTLELLIVTGMDNLKEIWPCDFRMSEEVKLRAIAVERCDKLVNLFPCNPLPLLHHLEELHVKECGSIEVLFNLDLDCVGVIEKGSISRLRSIYVGDSGKLREVWKIKGGENNFGLPIRGFQAVEIIKIINCGRFTYLFTPTTTNFDIGALINLDIDTKTNNGSVESSPQEIKLLSKEGTSEVSASISYNLFPSSVLHCFQNLHTLLLSSHHEVDVIFEIESTPKSQDNQKRLFPHLEELKIKDMERLSHIWNCNWNTFLNTQKQHPESSFHNLTTITMYHCKSIKHLFSPLMAILLSNLKIVEIGCCEGIEEVVSHIDDEEEKTASTSTHTSTALFPHLDSLTLKYLENLKCIGGRGVAKDGKNEMALNKTTTNATFLDPFKISQVDGVWWTLCQYPREISTTDCHSLSHIIPCYAVGQMIKLQKLNIDSCHGMREVFETERINKSVSMLKLTNLKILKIWDCDLLENIFTFSTLDTLGQLEELMIEWCKSMKVIVKEEEDASSSSSKAVVFPRLKLITLLQLPELVGFFLGMNEFQWPALDVLKISYCPKMKAFMTGGLKAPQLKYEETHGLDKHSPEVRAFNSHVTTTPTGLHPEISQVDGVWWTLCQYPREISIRDCDSLSHMIPCHAVGQMIKLQKLNIYCCDGMREVFETERINKSVSMLKLTNLKILGIGHCDLLENIFTFSTLETLGQLEELRIEWCKSMKVIVKEEEDASSSSSKVVVFPRLKVIKLVALPELVGFFIGTNEFQWPALDVLDIYRCPKMKAFTAGGLKAPQLKYEETHELDKHTPERAFNSHVTTTPSGLHPEFPLADDVSCIGMKEVFETQGIHKSVIMFQMANLKQLEIVSCDRLEHIFTFSTFETLGQLDNLMIGRCKAMKVIMKEEEDASSSTVVVFPRLKRITLFNVPELVGFFLGKNEFIWPSLDEVVVNDCPQMKVFTAGGSTAPQLKYVATRLGKYSPECWFKSHVTNTTAVLHQETPFPSLESSSSEEIDIWSFHNLIEIEVKDDLSVEKIIPSRELLKLQKLETIHVESCYLAEEVFEAFEAGNDSQTALVKLPNLIEVKLYDLLSLRYIWKSNQWTEFLFPNLTRLFIAECDKLEHVFSSSMVGSLLQLQELRIIKCEDMEEVFFGDGNIVVHEEEQEKEYDGKMNEVVFPLLKSLSLERLSHLKGFCLGNEDFSFPLLDTLTIQECPAMTTFTIGYSSTPVLKEIETEFGVYDVEKDINSLIKMKQEIMG